MDEHGPAKTELRRRMLAARSRVPGWRRRLAASAVCRSAGALSAVRRAGLVLAYHPVRGEVDCRPLIRSLLAEGRSVALPRVAGPGRLDFHRIRALEDLVEGAFSIPEPFAAPGTLVRPRDADVALVPGVAFSTSGQRLGYGGGYYDRALKRLAGAAVGLAYDLQVLPILPEGRRDERLRAVVTERRTFFPAHSLRSSTTAPLRKI